MSHVNKAEPQQIRKIEIKLDFICSRFSNTHASVATEMISSSSVGKLAVYTIIPIIDNTPTVTHLTTAILNEVDIF